MSQAANSAEVLKVYYDSDIACFKNLNLLKNVINIFIFYCNFIEKMYTELNI